MLSDIHFERILFIDIETVPQYPGYKEIPDQTQKLWDIKAGRIRQKESDTPEQLYERAGIYAEFGKIICIGAGFFRQGEFRIKAYYGDDERQILTDFAHLLDQYYISEGQWLCAHNGKEFDFPYLSRRMIIHGIRLPVILDNMGKKPWEVKYLDTMELWKFGDFKNYTSLELMASILGIQSPKDDIKGADIARVYWMERDIDRIATYCRKDVLTVAQVLLRLAGRTVIQADQIIMIN